MLFSLVEKHSPVSFLGLNALLFHFVAFILHASIFSLRFSQKQSANQKKKKQKIYKGMFYYLIEKHMQKFRHFWREKNFTRKKSLKSLLHQAIQFFMDKSSFIKSAVMRTE